jgi:hypothetical protein
MMSPSRRRKVPGLVVPAPALLLSACALAPLPLSRATEVRKAEVDESTASESADAESAAPSEFRITCKYEMGNCERRARKVCSGGYDVLNRSNSSCAHCGWSPADLTSSDDDVGTAVYHGALHVRCRR